jgi:Protein of unknown function (DUF4012)
MLNPENKHKDSSPNQGLQADEPKPKLKIPFDIKDYVALLPKKKSDIVQLEKTLLEKYDQFWEELDWQTKLQEAIEKAKFWIQKHVFKFFVILLILSVCVYFIFGAVRQSLGNLEDSKSSLVEKIKSILGKNDQDQLDTLNEVEAKMIEDLSPLVNTPVVGWVVKNDISKIKELVARWLDALYPFANYKFGVDGFRTILLQERYFTQDVESFLEKAPELIRQTRSQMNWFWLYRSFGSSQIKGIFEYLNIAMDILEILVQKKEIILTTLGHYQTQKVVIFNQNIGEARPTGGFTGSYIPINISKGEMTIGQSQSVYWFDKGANTNLLSHPAFWYYGWFYGMVDAHGARNSNIFPCFPDTAKSLEREFARSTNGYNIDDLVFITPQYLLGYLPNNFTLNIGGESVPKAKILDKIEQITALEIEDKNNPKKQLTSIFNLIVKQLPAILKGQALVDLIVYTQNALLSRDMQIWFRSEKIQNLWSTTGFSGEQTCQNRTDLAVITPIIVNLSGDKRNLITRTDFDIKLEGNTLTLNWKQTLPPDTKQQLRRGFNDDGLTMIGFQVPKNTKILDVQSPNMLRIPFLRDYYKLQLERENPIYQNKYTLPAEASQGVRTSYDLKDDYSQGFSYLQPDGSQVVAIYVKDDLIAQPLTASFQIDVSSSKKLMFYSQVGLNNPSLTLQNSILTDPMALQKGVQIR